MLTSNRALEEWPEPFGNPLLASAGLDGLTHGAHVMVLTGASFRAHGTLPTAQVARYIDKTHAQ